MGMDRLATKISRFGTVLYCMFLVFWSSLLEGLLPASNCPIWILMLASQLIYTSLGLCNYKKPLCSDSTLPY